ALVAASAGLGLVVVPGTTRAPRAAAAQSSTFNLVLSTSATGTSPFDAPASCTAGLTVAGQGGGADVIPTSANSTGTAPSPWLDHSPTDNTVRTSDTVTEKVNGKLVSFAGNFTIGGQPADSNLTVTTTLPLAANGQVLGWWTAIPNACYLTTSGVSPTI